MVNSCNLFYYYCRFVSGLSPCRKKKCLSIVFYLSDQNSANKMLAQVVDTSLLKCYLQTNEAMIAPLLRLDNNCHVEECERVLKKAKKYAELVSLYQNKGIHKKGTSFARKQLVF